MLNEIGEFNQYTVNLGTAKIENHRLKYFSIIKKSFAGLERALTIIARQKIFGDSDKPNLNVDEIKNYLASWCGFFDDKTLPLSGWLPNFINLNFSEPKFEEEIKQTVANLQNKKNQFARGVFSEINELRTITYDKIIANALLLGKLKRYYLIYDGSDADSVPKIFEDVRKFTDKNANGIKLRDAQCDMLLKLTAFYLLQKNFTTQNFVTFNQLNFFNWLNTNTKPESWGLENFKFQVSKENLFFTRTVTDLKVKKISVNPTWREKFRLVEECDIDNAENKGRIFFSDTGAADSLAKCNRYQ